MDKFIKKLKAFKYMAMDKDGDVYVFVDRPYIPDENANFWATDSGADGLLKIGTEMDEQLRESWKNSLIEFDIDIEVVDKNNS